MNDITCANLYAPVPPHGAGEWFETLAGNADTRVERIVSHGHHSPPGFWYEQSRHEWVVLLKGEAVLRFEQDGRELRLREGDHVNIPAGCRHRVEWTAPDRETTWLAVFY